MVSRVPVSPEVELLELHGEIDVSTASLVREQLGSAVKTEKPTVILDLTPVTFADSQAVRPILDTVKDLHERGARLITVVPPEHPAERLLTVTGLAETLAIARSRAEALAELGLGPAG